MTETPDTAHGTRDARAPTAPLTPAATAPTAPGRDSTPAWSSSAVPSASTWR